MLRKTIFLGLPTRLHLFESQVWQSMLVTLPRIWMSFRPVSSSQRPSNPHFLSTCRTLSEDVWVLWGKVNSQDNYVAGSAHLQYKRDGHIVRHLDGFQSPVREFYSCKLWLSSSSSQRSANRRYHQPTNHIRDRSRREHNLLRRGVEGQLEEWLWEQSF